LQYIYIRGIRFGNTAGYDRPMHPLDTIYQRSCRQYVFQQDRLDAAKISWGAIGDIFTNEQAMQQLEMQADKEGGSFDTAKAAQISKKKKVSFGALQQSVKIYGALCVVRCVRCVLLLPPTPSTPTLFLTPSSMLHAAPSLLTCMLHCMCASFYFL
jgi:hypothetical protein